jgi:hypothetical protein
MAGVSIFKSTIKAGQVMDSYLVINMETKEVYQRNGRAAEFGTFHQARVVRITLNDQTKVRHGFSYAMGDGWTERKKDWQIVIASAVSISSVQKEVNRRLISGGYERVKEPVYYASGDFKATHRAPQSNKAAAKRDNKINELTTIVSHLQAKVKAVRSDQVRMKARAERTTDPQRKLVCMQRLIELKQQEIEIKAKLDPAQKELLNKMARKRKNQNTTGASNPATPFVVRRRKTS